MRVGQHLHLDVARVVQVPLEEHRVVGEVRLALRAGPTRSARRQLVAVRGHLDALAAAAGRRLDGDRVADLPRASSTRRLGRLDGSGVPGITGTPAACIRRAGADLGAHRLDRVRRRADEHQPRRRAGAGEGGVLGQEAVAGVHRLGAGAQRRAHDRLGHQVALRGRPGADQVRLVRVGDERRLAVSFGVDRDRPDPHLPQRAEDADRDLAPVGDQHLGEHQAPILGARAAPARRESPPHSAVGGAGSIAASVAHSGMLPCLRAAASRACREPPRAPRSAPAACARGSITSST